MTETKNPDSIPEVIYHYCDVNAFMGIVNSKAIWKSHHRSMNDYYDSSWIYELLQKKVKMIIDSDKTKIELLKNFLNYFYINMKEYYISCFCEDGDSLSQWIAYANDGKGVSIGFTSKSFNVPHSIPIYGDFEPSEGLFRVLYISEEHDRLANDILNHVISSGRFYDIGGIDKYCLAIKNPKFKEEKEIRLAQIVPKNSMENPDVAGFRVLNVPKCFEYRENRYGGITPYKKYELIGNLDNYISKIILGPKCGITKTDIQLLLNKQITVPKRWDIKYSEVPYR